MDATPTDSEIGAQFGNGGASGDWTGKIVAFLHIYWRRLENDQSNTDGSLTILLKIANSVPKMNLLSSDLCPGVCELRVHS